MASWSRLALTLLCVLVVSVLADLPINVQGTGSDNREDGIREYLLTLGRTLEHEDEHDKSTLEYRLKELQDQKRPSNTTLDIVHRQQTRLQKEHSDLIARRDSLQEQKAEKEKQIEALQKDLADARTQVPAQIAAANQRRHRMTTTATNLTHTATLLSAEDMALVQAKAAQGAPLPEGLVAGVHDLAAQLEAYGLLTAQRAEQLQENLSRKEREVGDRVAGLAREIAELDTEIHHVLALIQGVELDLEQQRTLAVAVTATVETHAHLADGARTAYETRRDQRAAEHSNLEQILDVIGKMDDAFDSYSWDGVAGGIPPGKAALVTQFRLPVPANSLPATFTSTHAAPFLLSLSRQLRQAMNLPPKTAVDAAAVSVDDVGEENGGGLKVTLRVMVDIGHAQALLDAYSLDRVTDAARTVPGLGLAAGAPATELHAPRIVEASQTIRCPGNCSNKGECLPDGRCRCDPDWTGEACARPQCLSGCLMGTCVSPDICECMPGYVGRACDQKLRCSQPIATQKQRVSCEGSGIGDKCRYSCDPGYELSDISASVRECMSDGRWSVSAPVCTPMKCPPPPALKNGHANCDGFVLGSTCKFACYDGYQLAGPATEIRCTENRTWDHPMPFCQPITCPPAPPISGNATVKCSGRGIGALCHQTCRSGYKQPAVRQVPGRVLDETHPNHIFRCTETGEWVGAPLQCNILECPKLNSPVGGSMECSGNVVGSSCHFKCDNGKRILHPASESRVCMTSGAWSGPPTECAPVDCGHPSANKPLPNGHYACEGTNFGDTCSVACDPGYKLLSNVSYTRTCLADGGWSGEESQDVYCEPLGCARPEVVGGVVECTGLGYGHQCSVDCDKGRMLSSDPNPAIFEPDHVPSAEPSRCFNGEWSPPLPACAPKKCAPIDADPLNGNVTCARGDFMHGDECQVTCADGDSADGWETTKCIYGHWSRPLGPCTPARCGRAPLLPGTPVCIQLDHNSKCNYLCDRHDADVPVVVDVGLEAVSGGGGGGMESKETEIAPGQELHVVAAKGSRAQAWRVTNDLGSDIKLVRQSTEHVTQGPLAGDLLDRLVFEGVSLTGGGPAHVMLSLDSENDEGHATLVAQAQIWVTVRTADDSQIPFSLTCNKGEWEGDVPDACATRLKPPRAPELLNGVTQCGLDNDGLHTCEYSCRDGYRLQGAKTRKFVAGKFVGDPPICLPITCPDLPIPRNALAVKCSGYGLRDTCEVVCQPGHTSSAAPRICTEHGWTGGDLTCETRVKCGPIAPKRPVWADCKPGATFAGGACEMKCMPGFRPSTNALAVARCLPTGQWDHPSFTCEEIKCPSLDAPQNGHVALTGKEYGATASYMCVAGHELVGAEHRACLSGGIWSDTPPTCIPVTCAPPPTPSNGYATCEGTHLGQRCRFGCDDGFTLAGSELRTCDSNGLWTGPVTRCDPNECVPLEQSTATDNGLQLACTGHHYLDRCIASCPDGHKLLGSRVRVCDGKGGWTGSVGMCLKLQCPHLPDPEHGHTECSGSVIGETCETTCNPGHTVVGDSRRVCANNGKWSGTPAHCAPFDCGTPLAPNHGSAECSGTAFNSTCTFDCLAGFNLEGSRVRTCAADGAWDGAPAVCSPVSCGTLSPPQNGFLECSGTTLLHHCRAACDDGYELVKGDSDRTCGRFGEWLGNPAVCRPRRCPQLELHEGLSMFCSGSDDRAPDATCYFACEEGYRLTGAPTRKCTANGAWTGANTTCTPVTCGLPPVPERGPSADCSSLDFNATCTLQCSEDPGQLTLIRCMGDGQWRRESGPACDYASCPPPTLPSGILHDCDEGRWVGGNCMTRCDVGGGYRALAPFKPPFGPTGELSCQADGTWKVETPLHCQLPTCHPLRPIPNGIRQCTGHGINSTCTATCLPGYTPTPLSTNPPSVVTVRGPNNTTRLQELKLETGSHVCVEGAVGSWVGQWVGQDIDCAPVQCPSPDPVQGGTVRCHGTSFGDMCFFDCDSAHQLANSTSGVLAMSRHCGADGQFTLQSPTCEPKVCGEPPKLVADSCDVPSEVARTGDYSCQVKCGDGQIGGGTFQCDSAGWSGHMAPCRPIDCGTPPAPPHGHYTCDGTTYNSRCTLRCDDPDAYYTWTSDDRATTNEVVLTCTANGTWAGSVAACLPFECPKLPSAPFVRSSCSGHSVGDQCLLECSDGYEIAAGAWSRTCEKGGTWSGYMMPVCTAHECDVLDSIDYPETVVCDGTAQGSTCRLTCSPGYRPVSTTERVCHDGTWSGEALKCEPVTCTPPDSPDHSHVSCKALPEFLDTCQVTCFEGYDMSPRVFHNRTSHVCLDDGTWSNYVEKVVDCELIQCPHLIYPPSVNLNCTGTGLDIGNTCTATCVEGYTSPNEHSVTHECRADGTWNPFQNLECLPVLCPPFAGPEGAQWHCSGQGYNDTCFSVCPVGMVMNVYLPDGPDSGLTVLGDVLDDSSHSFLQTEEKFLPYTLVEDLTARCGPDGHWSFVDAYCAPAKCPPMTPPDHGRLVCDGEIVGSRCRVMCDDGATQVGPSIKTCVPGGIWESDEESKCVPVDCGEPHIPAGATASPIATHYGARVSVDCPVGSRLVGSRVRACDADGAWTGVEPSCELVECGVPPSPVDGSVDCNNGTTFGSVCTYECLQPPDETHVQSSLAERPVLCGEDGKWAPVRPLAPCELSTCPRLQQPRNGHMECNEALCKNIRCNEGYELVSASSVLECENGQWNGELPTCAPLSCPLPGRPEHGKLEIIDHRRLKVVCHPGFRLPFDPSRSEYIRTCTSDGWQGPDVLSCQRLSCGAPPPLLLSSVGNLEHPSHPDSPLVTVPSDVMYGDAALFSCPVGYHLEGSSHRICQENGKWSGDNARCVPNTCTLPTLPTGFAARYDEGETPPFNPGCQLTIECTTGSDLHGHNWIECMPDGQWSSLHASCLPTDCGRPREIAEAAVNCSGTAHGDRCEYSCPGNPAVKSTEVTCAATGKWEGPTPDCGVATCPLPLRPENAYVSCPDGHRVGSVCHVTCAHGYDFVPKIAGSRAPHQMTCAGSGEPHWEGTAIGGECVMRHCEPLDNNIPGMTATCARLSSEAEDMPSECVYDCAQGYQLTGVQSLACQANTEWTAAVPACEVVTCPALLAPEHAVVVEETSAESHRMGSKATVACAAGHRLVLRTVDGENRKNSAGDTVTMHCSSFGTWEGPTVECEPITCQQPDAIEHGSVKTDGGELTHGRFCEYACEPGYKTYGVETSLSCSVIDVALKLGEDGKTYGRWVDSKGVETLPQCVPIQCPQLKEIEHGSTVCSRGGADTAGKFGSTCHTACGYGYRMISSLGETSTRTCDSHGRWTGSAPICRPVECNQPSVVAHGRMSCPAGATYSQECELVCDAGFHPKGLPRNASRVVTSCEADSRWKHEPVCEAITCPPLPAIEKGHIDVDMPSHEFGAVAITKCDAGYAPTGTEKRLCQADGRWSGVAGTCEKLSCDEPQLPTSSHLIPIPGTDYPHYQSTVGYRCEDGYDLSIAGDSQRYVLACQADGKWSAQPPQCEPVNCGHPIPGAHVTASCPDGTRLGSTCTFTCQDGAAASSGDTSRVCGKDRAWTGQPLKCEAAETVRNLAANQPTMQSSTKFGGSSDLPVMADTNTHRATAPYAQCAHTFAEKDPWWQVDLGAAKHVHRVVLGLSEDAPVDTVRGVTVRVTHDSQRPVELDGGSPREETVCATNVVLTKGTNVDVACATGGVLPVLGQYVVVTAEGRGVSLTLCRVEVFGSDPTARASLDESSGLLDATRAAGAVLAEQSSVGAPATHAITTRSSECSSTLVEDQPWWRVDLGVARSVHHVTLELLEGSAATVHAVEVRVGYSLVAEGNHNPACGETAVSGAEARAECNGLTGRYVNVRLPSARGVALALCGVRVWVEDRVPAPLVDLASHLPLERSSQLAPFPGHDNTCPTSILSDYPSFSLALHQRAVVDHVVVAMGQVGTPLLEVDVGGHTCRRASYAAAGEVLVADCEEAVGERTTVAAMGWNQVLSVCKLEVWGVMDPQ